MIAINLDHVTVTYIAHPIFTALSWEIHSERCVGLIGPNGCGKSTLLRLIAGELTSDTGFVVRANGLKFGYLTQEPRLTLENSVLEEALTASTALAEIEHALSAACALDPLAHDLQAHPRDLPRFPCLDQRRQALASQHTEHIAALDGA